MSEPRTGNWMMTCTGRMFYPYDLRDEDFCIEDIAGALAKLCRYGGHCKKFYSVAEHSVIASRLVPKHMALVALMHDATEAYLVDMPRPIKVGFPQYKEMEAKLWSAIARKFKMPQEMPHEVEEADGHMLWHEMSVLLHPLPPGTQWGMGRPKPDVIRGDLIKCWSWQDAERFFLSRFHELAG